MTRCALFVTQGHLRGKISSLRRFKDDVKSVKQGYECGIGVDGYQDIKVGDIIEGYRTERGRAYRVTSKLRPDGQRPHGRRCTAKTAHFGLNLRFVGVSSRRLGLARIALASAPLRLPAL